MAAPTRKNLAPITMTTPALKAKLDIRVLLKSFHNVVNNDHWNGALYFFTIWFYKKEL